MRGRKLHLPVAALVLMGGVLLTASLEDDLARDTAVRPDVAPIQPARLVATTGSGRTTIQGTTASAAHESALRHLAAQHYGDSDTVTEFVPGVLLPKGWEDASSRLLYVLAATESAEARMDAVSITIRGVTVNPEIFASRLEFLRETLGDELDLSVDMVYVPGGLSLDELCKRSFAALVIEPVSFIESSAAIRDASFASLDRLVDFANDCASTTIAIIGHTDASGDETWNRQLSLARAQAVADRMIARGIEPKRLIVEGRGSAEPVAANDTAPGREENRRIEFELR